MPSPRPHQAHLLLVCLCASVQRVVLSSIRCGISWCSGNHCCDDHCCSLFSDEWSNWLVVGFILVAILFGSACIFALCRCYKNCAALQLQEGAELAQPPATPAPRTGPLESPPEWPPEDPPPYSEVVAKPFAYPLPALPPLSYSHGVGAEPPSMGVSPPDHTRGVPASSPPAGFASDGGGRLGEPPPPANAC